MSSKSRKHSRKKVAPSRPKTVAAEREKPAAAESHGILEIPDEYIKAPRKKSKLTYAFLVFMLIFLLLLFISGDAFSVRNRLSGINDPIRLRWMRPGHGEVAVKASELQHELLAFNAAAQIDPFAAMGLDLSERDTSEEVIARILVLDQLAEDAGIRITDADLAEHLQFLVQFRYRESPEAYQAYADSIGQANRIGGIEEVEKVLRRALRVQRYLELLAFAGALPSPDDIDALWNQAHEELAYDYVEVACADLAEAARAELPDDAALEKWLGEQTPAERAAFELPERRALELVAFRDPVSTAAAGLLAAFPPPGDVDPEERARSYYDRVFARRFVQPPSEGGEATQPPGFLSFEEVRDRCLAEAPVFDALQAWLGDLQARAGASETIDLAAEAAQHGLEFSAIGPLSREELEADPELGAPALVDSAFLTAPGSFAYTVAPSEKGLSIVRVVERVAPSLPPLADIREKVAERWIEIRSREIARERLAQIWEGFEVFTPERSEEELLYLPEDDRVHRRMSEEHFRSAAEAAGFSVQKRDFVDKGARPESDLTQEGNAQQFLRENNDFTVLAEGEVAEPRPSRDGARVYLVRVAGKRAVPIDALTPGEYWTLKQQAHNRALQEAKRDFDLAYLQERYELVLERTASPEDSGDEPPPER